MKHPLIRYALASLALAVTTFAHTEVPISIATSGHATVPVLVEGTGTREFVLDTGAEVSAVYEGFSKAAGLNPIEETTTLVGQTGATAVSLVALPTLTVDGKMMNGINAVVLPPRADGAPLNGIIGLDVFGHTLLDFDLPAKRAVLHASGTALAATRSVRVTAAIPTAGKLLTVPVRLNGVEAVAVIDTGARKTRINWKLGKKLGFSPAHIGAGDVIQGATNNPVQAGSASVANVRLGQRVRENMPVQVVDLPVFELFGVADRHAVILGLDWLVDTRMIIDFPQRKVWFVEAAK